MATIAYIDTETDSNGKKVLDIGGIRTDGSEFHGRVIAHFAEFLKNADYVCGHNIFHHDLKFVAPALFYAGIPAEKAIDTLYLSPLLFPRKPYHSLLKDDKLQSDELNNPLNDSKKAKKLFEDEVVAFSRLDEDLKRIFFRLLRNVPEFKAFFSFLNYRDNGRNIFSRIFSNGS